MLNLRKIICLVFGLCATLPTPQCTAMQQDKQRHGFSQLLRNHGVAAICVFSILAVAMAIRTMFNQIRETEESNNRAVVHYNAEGDFYLADYRVLTYTGIKNHHDGMFGYGHKGIFRVAADGQPVEITTQDAIATPAVAPRIEQEYAALIANPATRDVVNTWPADAYKKELISHLPGDDGICCDPRSGNDVVYRLDGQEYRVFLHNFISDADRLTELVRRAHQQRLAHAAAAPAANA